MSMIISLKNILLIATLSALNFYDSSSESTDKSQSEFYKKSKPTTLSELTNNTSKMGVNLSVGGINEIKIVCR